MSGNTTNEGFPFPLSGDFADVQDAYRLAQAIDSDLRGQQNAYRTFMGRPSFIGMQSATQSGVTQNCQVLQMGTVEWDNTGGLSPGGTLWTQPISQPPSWWMFGATVRVNPTGSQVVGDLNVASILVQTTDQVTGLFSLTQFDQRNDDTNTNGEWINLFAMAPIYRGLAEVQACFWGSTAKGILAGSRFWGMYLGPVN
jgi:hypothetical protein